MNDEAIQKIQRYLEGCLVEPERNWPKDLFRERSYERWAIHEILSLILDNPFREAELIVWQFALQMECFLHIAESSTTKTMFTVAENTAEEILGLIL